MVKENTKIEALDLDSARNDSIIGRHQSVGYRGNR